MTHKRIIGLRNIVTTKDKWYYLLFYDIDREITVDDKDFISRTMNLYHQSYILYSTKHGYHLIGFTPNNIKHYASLFNNVDSWFKSYFSGQTIRVSLKEGETQTLIMLNTGNGEIIPNLYNLYAKRFNIEPIEYDQKKYYLVFEKYWSKSQ